jgi:hypothetical protein
MDGASISPSSDVNGVGSLDVALPFEASVAGIDLQKLGNSTPTVFVQSINLFNGSQLNITAINMDHFFDFGTFGPQELLALLQSFSAFLGQYHIGCFYIMLVL